jgi:hypothetical protein
MKGSEKRKQPSTNQPSTKHIQQSTICRPFLPTPRIFIAITERETLTDSHRLKHSIHQSLKMLRLIPQRSLSHCQRWTTTTTGRSPTLRKGLPSSIRQTSSSSSSTTTSAAKKYRKTRAGTGQSETGEDGMSMISKGPVSWIGLGLATVAAASAVSYYQIERERRLENAMGKIVRWQCNAMRNATFFLKRREDFI